MEETTGALRKDRELTVACMPLALCVLIKRSASRDHSQGKSSNEERLKVFSKICVTSFVQLGSGLLQDLIKKR